MRKSLHHSAFIHWRTLLIGTLMSACAASAWAQTPPPANPAGKPAERPLQIAPARSLFFTAEEIRSLERALDIYARNTAATKPKEKGPEDFLKQLAGSGTAQQQPMEPVERFFTYPQFFMESLVYQTPVDWVVRINNIRYTQTTKKQGKLEVIRVDKDSAVLQWQPANMDRIKEVVMQAPEGKVEGVDLKRGLVVFTLRPNQTYSSYVMRVLEGKVKSVTVDNNPAVGLTPVAAPTAAQPATPAAAAAAATATADEAAATAADQATRALLPATALPSPLEKEKKP